MPLECTKGSIIHLERGIALAEIGRDEDALKTFETAIRDARTKQGPWEQNLHARMVDLKDRHTLALWVAVVRLAE